MSDSYINPNLKNGLVIFLLKDKLFCADIDIVFAIVNPADYPQNFKDSYIVNSHLEIENFTMSVLDLHSLFDLQKNGITSLSRFICIEINGQAFGFLADKVQEVITLSSSTRNDFEFIETKDVKNISGEVKYRNMVYTLLDFNKIMNTLPVND